MNRQSRHHKSPNRTCLCPSSREFLLEGGRLVSHDALTGGSRVPEMSEVRKGFLDVLWGFEVRVQETSLADLSLVFTFRATRREIRPETI